MSKEQINIIGRQETLALIDFPGLIKVAEEAFIAQAEGRASAPAYINMPIGESFAHYKAGYIEGKKHFALKFSGGFWGNSKLGLPIDYGFVIVHSAETGKPYVIFLDQGAITDYRTAAAGAVASKYTSRTESEIVGVLGTGVQAHLQVEALTHVRSQVKTVKIWGRNPGHVDDYIKDMTVKLPHVEFVVCSEIEKAVHNSDILITATPSREPLVKAKWISSGTSVVAVGACAPYMQEHEPEILARANKIYADSIEKCSHDGEIHHALESKVIGLDKITGEIGNLILGKIPGRESDGEITFVDLVGLGVQDATAAEYLLSKYLSGLK